VSFLLGGIEAGKSFILNKFRNGSGQAACPGSPGERAGFSRTESAFGFRLGVSALFDFLTARHTESRVAKPWRRAEWVQVSEKGKESFSTRAPGWSRLRANFNPKRRSETRHAWAGFIGAGQQRRKPNCSTTFQRSVKWRE
jgi:hypothetical protein